ncbi:Rha family transcriptional regulator [Shewanella algae]|uniref:Rha family transcriptional regulator n=1 Tax=Shewanella algae TaxID=38313 RepID=UPI000B8B1C20|nr:Rha family transcriptional regulator [Shewanella algae]
MSTQVSTNNVPTMSSREIAELTGKTHANVCRDIRNMLEQLAVNSNLRYQQNHIVTDACPQTKRISAYHLPRRECEILITNYDVVSRAAVIDRWLEQEAKQRQVPSITNALLLVEIAKQHAEREEKLAVLSEQQKEDCKRLAKVEHRINTRGLPAIRKDNAYVMGEEKVTVDELSEDELVTMAMNILQRKIDRMKAKREKMTVRQ